MKLALIWAAAENGVIGRDGDLPWRLPRDLAFFKRTTKGHTIVMGRRTWESLPGALPGRRNLVVSRRSDYTVDGAEVYPSLDAALEAAGTDDLVFVVGGAELYRVALPLADELFVTTVHADVDGDTVFPEFDRGAFHVVASERFEADEANEFACTFEKLVRR
ncbi:MAG: dihydrofolate reductase [Planctomycetes bacterium]|nr:dihydrofolate reductase [Planctomycetota bacterium]